MEVCWVCSGHSDEISLAEEAGLECQRKGFRLYLLDNVELYSNRIHSVTRYFQTPGEMLETKVKDRHRNKCHKSDWCSDEHGNYDMAVDSIYVGLACKAAGFPAVLLA